MGPFLVIGVRIGKARTLMTLQLIAVFGAVAVQFPYTYFSDVYLASVPSASLLFLILPTFFIEDIISLLIAHIILFRTDII